MREKAKCVQLYTTGTVGTVEIKSIILLSFYLTVNKYIVYRNVLCIEYCHLHKFIICISVEYQIVGIFKTQSEKSNFIC